MLRGSRQRANVLNTLWQSHLKKHKLFELHSSIKENDYRHWKMGNDSVDSV
jgi:hypothetical protein